MCRLAIYRGIDPDALGSALRWLERSLGGHGNGIYAPESGGIVKGLRFGTDEAARRTANAEHTALFHTRLATAGGVADGLNHPFAAGDYALAHNGHWSGWTRFADAGRSDTETAASLVAGHGPGVLLGKAFAGSGVWALIRGDETLVIPRSRGLVLHYLPGGAFFHASERVGIFPARACRKLAPGAAYRILADGRPEPVGIFPVELEPLTTGHRVGETAIQAG